MTRFINMYALDFWYETEDDDPDSSYTLIGDETSDYVIAAEGILTYEEVWQVAEQHNEMVKADAEQS